MTTNDKKTSHLTEQERRHIAHLQERIKSVVVDIEKEEGGSQKDDPLAYATLLTALIQHDLRWLHDRIKEDVQLPHRMDELLEQNLALTKQSRRLFWLCCILLGAVIGIILVTYLFPPADKAAEMNGAIISQIYDQQTKNERNLRDDMADIKHSHKDFDGDLLAMYGASVQAYQNLDEEIKHTPQKAKITR